MTRRLFIAILLFFALPSRSAEPAWPPSASAALKQPADWFPTAVWLQGPHNAARYKDIGINLYVGLYRGPTEEQLAGLKKAGIFVICHQSEVGLNAPSSDIILAWMHGDEPDNAQAKRGGGGYGPPIAPEKIVADYQKFKVRDPKNRPIFLNLGQGVAWDNWIGRGVRTRHPEDYPEYLKGCDIASFDIYPAVHTHKEVAGNLWYVARGVDRLRTWSEGKKPLFACIETTNIDHPDRKPTPAEVRAEVWMAITHGATGILYFAHSFKPRTSEAALLGDGEMAAAVKEINSQLHELAPVLNTGEVVGGLKVESLNAAAPIATLVKRHEGATYVFAVAMRGVETTATFALPGLAGIKPVQPIGEPRLIASKEGRWTDSFAPYAVHLYKIDP